MFWKKNGISETCVTGENGRMTEDEWVHGVKFTAKES